MIKVPQLAFLIYLFVVKILYQLGLSQKKKIREEVLESLNRVKVPYLIDRQLGALSGGELQTANGKSTIARY